MREIAPDKLLLAAVENGVTDPNYHPEEPIMAEIFQLQPRDSWQFTCEVIRKPDGKLVAVLVDARGSLIESELEPAAKLANIAKMLEESVAGMRATAQAVKS
jgi:hypothetical protein